MFGSSVQTEVKRLRSNLRMRFSVHSSDGRQVLKKHSGVCPNNGVDRKTGYKVG